MVLDSYGGEGGCKATHKKSFKNTISIVPLRSPKCSSISGPPRTQFIPCLGPSVERVHEFLSRGFVALDGRPGSRESKQNACSSSDTSGAYRRAPGPDTNATNRSNRRQRIDPAGNSAPVNAMPRENMARRMGKAGGSHLLLAPLLPNQADKNPDDTTRAHAAWCPGGCQGGKEHRCRIGVSAAARTKELGAMEDRPGHARASGRHCGPMGWPA